MLRITGTLSIVFIIASLAACGDADCGDDRHRFGPEGSNAFGEVAKAICVLSPTNNAQQPEVAGTVTFTQTKSGVLIQADVTGLKPNAKHAIGIYRWGDRSAHDASAAGPRYDPHDVQTHALPDVHSHGDEVHAKIVGQPGGLGNLETDDQGNASYTLSFENLSLTTHHALLGRSVVIHLNEDTGEASDGNVGPRIAQGVIGIANPE